MKNEYPKYPQLPNKRYDVIYADPPWDYKGGRQHSGKGGTDTGGAAMHYPTLTLMELKQLDIPSISADDCLLFLWTTGTHLDQAIELGKAWGFAYKDVAFVWDKQQTNPGNYTLTQCEFVLGFSKGTHPEEHHAKTHQLLSCKRGKHSVKPDKIRDRIYTMYPDVDRIELFARPLPLFIDEKWEYWGNHH